MLCRVEGGQHHVSIHYSGWSGFVRNSTKHLAHGDQAPKKPKISETLCNTVGRTPAPILGNSSHYLQDFWKKPPGGFLIQISEVNLNTSKRIPKKRPAVQSESASGSVQSIGGTTSSKPSQKSVFGKNNLKIYQLHNLFGFEV